MIQARTGEYADEHRHLVDSSDAAMALKPGAFTIRIMPWAREHPLPQA
ncbi:MAG: hypothetical protein KDI01_09940 [Halioglobus sp.]|nr:hypothetical protein [Halioglobus sp.]